MASKSHRFADLSHIGFQRRRQARHAVEVPHSPERRLFAEGGQALGLYLMTMYAYDSLLMPPRFWAELSARDQAEGT